jgi:cell division FtsZ-interacting protein ZapD
VERDVFDRVQALIKQRHKPWSHNHENVLKNIKVLVKTVDSGKIMDSLSKKLSKQKKTDKLETEKAKMVNQLIERIEIGHLETVNGEKVAKCPHRLAVHPRRSVRATA